MSVPGLFKIPEGSRAAFLSTLESFCQPGPSFPVARGKPGVPGVQNEQGRKWDIQLRNAEHAWFSRRTWTVSRTARPPGHRLPPDRFHPPRQSSLRIANFFWGTPHFPKFLKLHEKLKICPFRTSRDDFDQKEAPHAPASASSRCARPFPTFPCFAQKVSIFEKNANWKIRKNSSGCYRNPTFSNSPKIHPTPGTFSKRTSVTSSGSGNSKQLHPGR